MFIFALVGIIVGRFLNICIDRLPRGEPLLRSPFYCASCQNRLAPLDLIPVFGYLRMRGRCRYCGVAISPRTILVELGTGIIFGLLWWKFGFSAQLAIVSFYSCLLILILAIDLEHSLILNKVIYPAALIALVVAASWSNIGIVSSIIACGIAFGFLLLLAIVSKGGMGYGDVKMGGVVGLMTGFPWVLIALLISIITGGLVAGVLLLLRLKKRNETIPFGPFLALGTIATLIAGDALWAQYLRLLGSVWRI